MLDGVTPVPAEFAARYRERGYWADQPLFEGFTGALADAFTSGLHAAFYASMGFMAIAAALSALRAGSSRASG